MTGTIEDLLGFTDPRSLVRRFFQGEVSLDDKTLPMLEIDDSYSTATVTISAGQDALDYDNLITEICKEGRHTGKHEKFKSAVYEAFRNAHQWGNNKDPHKKIYLAYKATESEFEVVIADEGGKLLADFFPFVLMHRIGMDTAYSFYEFTDAKVKLPENSGIGTFVIHYASDEVRYYVAETGGLAVQMKIRKD